MYKGVAPGGGVRHTHFPFLGLPVSRSSVSSAAASAGAVVSSGIWEEQKGSRAAHRATLGGGAEGHGATKAVGVPQGAQPRRSLSFANRRVHWGYACRPSDQRPASTHPSSSFIGSAPEQTL